MGTRRMLLALVASVGLLGAVPAAATAPSSATPSSLATPSTAILTASATDVIVDAPFVIETIGDLDPNDPALIERMEAVDAQLDQRAAANPRVGLAPGQGAARAGFVASFDANVPADVRAAVGQAVGTWGSVLESPLPVVVQVSWICLGDPGILGYAGASEIYHLVELPTDYGYPNALANLLTGRDLNGSNPEVRVVLNAELAASNTCSFAADRWYTGTGTPPATQVDMLSVVLHEVAHGIGFLGSAWRKPGANQPTLESPPYAYDALVHAAGGRLLDQPDPSSQLTTALSIDVGGGALYGLYSPGYFINGSSFSHFSSATTGGTRGGSMMTPELGSGSVQRTIDAAVLGVLTQQGWTTTGAPVSPSLGATTGSAQIALTIDPNLAQIGDVPQTYRILARRGNETDASITVSASQSSVTLGPLYNGFDYRVEVTPEARGTVGVTSNISVTMPDTPNQPRQVAATGGGAVQTIAWQPPIGADGSESYQVEQRLIGGPWTSIGSTNTSSLTTAALPQGVYQFRVSAVRNGRRGPSGASLLVGVSDGIIRPLPLDGEVGRLFTAYFLRSPDRSGYDYWLRERASGTSLADISSAFAASTEFRQRYGALDDPAFVDRIYRNVLGRAADAAGLTYWVGQLQAGRNRGQVMTGFSESPEFIANTATVRSTSSSEGRISRLYFASFFREPDSAGLEFWMNTERRGSSLETIAVEMTKSPEFVATYGNMTDARFVELVYNNVLTRSPDEGGRSYWLAQLARGVDRGVMIAGFSASKEFVLRTGTLP